MGADIDAKDDHGFTALLYAGTRHIAEHLLRLGASPAAILRLGSLPFFISRWGPASSSMLSLYFGVGSGIPEWKLNGLIDTSLSGPRYITACGRLDVSLDNVRSLNRIGVDFIGEDSSGRSLMHCILCSVQSANLALRDFGLEKATPFPWHLNWISLVDMAFLTSKFAALRRALSFETFHRILNLEPERGWSPLCRAAALDRVDIIENCLSMNADIDFEGSHLGSALVVACICGSLKAARSLVRHGAAISYTGSKGCVSALTQTRSAAVRKWLLVGRFTEILNITESEYWTRGADGELEMRPWSGLVQAGVALVGKLERQRGESSIIYAGRLGRWKKRKLGMVMTVSDGLIFPSKRSL